MSKSIQIITLGCLIAIIFIQLTCNKPDSSTKKELKQQISVLKDHISSMEVRLVQLDSTIQKLDKEKEKIIEEHNYYVTQIDSTYLAGSDTLIYNAIIRYWTDRIYNTEGFFSPELSGTLPSVKNTPDGRVLFYTDPDTL